MTEPRTFPFGGVPVYNPQSLSKTEALAQFHVRQAAYQSLMDQLREERPSHVLIIGTRGMGKTTLLQRVRYGVEDDPELKGRYLALVFPEEQYNVNRLDHFLLNAVDALADAMERLGDQRRVARVEAFVEMAGKLAQEEIEERVPKFLAEIGEEIGRSLLLLVDNADRLFETIESQEQWRLRELLASRRDLTLFGATSQASDGIYGHDRAFFEFFKVYRLTPLTLAEVKDLLLRLSESVDEPEREKGNAKKRVQEWLDADAARLRTLVQLTGGNPRTTVLLFHLVLDGLAGGAREYLEQLLDQCTPNYKGRVDELPAQAQQVLDAVALRWDPATAMEVAEDTRLETTTVSAQLTRLVRQGLVEKADPGDSKKALYQVSERFFNIWYLMRASRRVRAKLRWFVEFLRVFFDSDELEKMAWERLECLRNGRRAVPEEIENAFAFVLASRAGRKRFEDHLRREFADSESLWGPYLGLIEGSAEGDVAAEGIATRPAKGTDEEILAAREATQAAPDNAENWKNLGRVLRRRMEFAEEAEAAYRKAIELDPSEARFWDGLGDLLFRIPERQDEAEAAYRKAIQLDPLEARFWDDLGCLLVRIPERRDEAEAAFRKAIDIDPTIGWIWNHLGKLLEEAPQRIGEAELAYRKAVEVNPAEGRFWNRLGGLLASMSTRHEEAESAHKKAIELDPTGAWFWNDLGELLESAPERWGEAEAAYRKAIELDAGFAWSWVRIGNLLARIPERWKEAEAAYRKAIDIYPEAAAFWQDLGVFLAFRARKVREGTAALREAVRLHSADSLNLRNLGVLLYCEGIDESEGVQYIRQASEADPTDPESAAILAGCVHLSGTGDGGSPNFLDEVRDANFWDYLLDLCDRYLPFGKILSGICDLVLERDDSNPFARLHRAVALAQLGDFPRASVALEDALVGDPIDLLAFGRGALEVFLAAAVRNGRVRDCLELLDKKEWKDAWRPIYEALRAVEAGTGEYLKRVAVEIRGPAMVILRRIAPKLSGLSASV